MKKTKTTGTRLRTLFSSKKRKAALTLIEIMVGLALAAIVITFSLGYLRQLGTSNVKAKALKREVLAREVAFLKLSRIFSQIDGAVGPMRTENETLSFGYEQDQPDPQLSQALRGELALNQRHELHLMTTADDGKSRDEILLDKVAKLSFSFFCPEEKHWQSTWTKETPPSLLKIVLLPKGEEAVEHIFPFVLSYGKDAMVSYKGKKI